MQIKHLFKIERESKLERSLEPSRAIVLRGTDSHTDLENFDTNQPMALVSAIKAELEKDGFLNTPEVQAKFQQLEKLGQILQSGFKEQSDGQSFKIERQKLLAIVEQIRQAPDVNTLLKTTVTQVQQYLQVDRAIIYRFQDKDRGVVLAEELVNGYTPSLGETIAVLMFGGENESAERQQQVLAIDDIYQLNLRPYQLQLLERFQVKASISLPIVLAGEMWGLLVVQQCSDSRQWQENEISLLYQIVTELTINLQPVEFRTQLQSIAQQQKVLARVIEKIQRSPDINTIFRTATGELQRLLKADRVAIYRFNPDWSGEFVAESVATGWVSLLQEQERDPSLKGDISDSGVNLKQMTAYSTSIVDTYLQETRGGDYTRGERFKRVDDIYAAGFSPCYLETLEKFQAKAYIIVPVFQDSKLWGLLAAYQNSGSRHWEDGEINIMLQLSSPLGIALQQTEVRNQLQQKVEQIAKSAELERTIARIIEKIRSSLDIKSIFSTTTREMRQLLKADRVVLYRFNADWSGEFVAESVGSGWRSLLQEQKAAIKADATDNERCVIKNIAMPPNVITDTYLQETRGGYAKDKQFLRVDDIYSAGFSACYMEFLEKYQVRAYITVPIFQNDKLWGLLAAYQNSDSRHWQDVEVQAMVQVSSPLSIALQQAESLQQVRDASKQLAASAAREQAVARITSRLLRSLDTIEAIYKIATQEVRQMLSVDRVALYKFKPDWSGEFVAESVAVGWSRLQEIMPVIDDTYLQETKGGRYRNSQTLAVNDIYAAQHSPCHIELLEQMQVRAYAIVPVFINQQLWGLLGAYQNSAPRVWEAAEVSALAQIGIQVGAAMQQVDYLKQVRQQSEQLTQIAQREKETKEQLQQRAIQLLIAVRPALNGDLTVRAPITDDEVGTIADAYNNTLQSLRRTVTQLQSSSGIVALTCQGSESDLSALAMQAREQLQALNRALEQVQVMVNSTAVVATDAQQVELAAQRANQTVRQGDAAMNRTVDGIQAIRETVAQTNKLIKRLSESSQKISGVVNLIGSFTTQTQLLALNASIEATRAGEYGRGFAVVADEVRSLARQSAAANTEIGKLVQEIQAGTDLVSKAMETGIQQVNAGTSLVNDTRSSLNAIVEATAEISHLVEGITEATQMQTQQSQSVTHTMNEVANIANKTSVDSMQLAAAFKELLTMAQDLQASVGQFKVE